MNGSKIIRNILPGLREIPELIRYEYRHLSLDAADSMGFLTYRCTSRCKTCNIWKRNSEQPQELGRDEWLTILARLKDHGIRSFEIFGGDALLRKDAVFDMIQYCAQNGIQTYFPTNGNLCDKETIRSLIECGLHTVYLSIDDVGAKHDGIRGIDGTFQKITDALENFIDIRGSRTYPKIIICNTLSNMNYRDFPRIIRFLEQYRIDAVYPRFLGEFSQENINQSKINGVQPEPYFVSSEDSSHLLNREQLVEFKELIKQTKKHPHEIYVNFRALDVAHEQTFLSGQYDYKHCHIATTFVTLSPNGEVAPCPFYRSYVIGNLLETGLDQIWGNEKHRQFVALQKKRKIAICRNCNMRVYYPSMLETLRYYTLRAKELLS